MPELTLEAADKLTSAAFDHARNNKLTISVAGCD
jgi:uncharacterized protein GlcG (DUF336 family)